MALRCPILCSLSIVSRQLWKGLLAENMALLMVQRHHKAVLLAVAAVASAEYVVLVQWVKACPRLPA